MQDGLLLKATENATSTRNPAPHKTCKKVETCAEPKEGMWLTLELETLALGGIANAISNIYFENIRGSKR